MTQSSNSAAAPAVNKQGGYPELEQKQPASGAQRTAERALGKRMRNQNADGDGQQTAPAETTDRSTSHGR